MPSKNIPRWLSRLASSTLHFKLFSLSAPGRSGFATTLMVAGTAFGPLLFALGFERFGSYTLTLTLALLAPLGVGIVALGSELRSS